MWNRTRNGAVASKVVRPAYGVDDSMDGDRAKGERLAEDVSAKAESEETFEDVDGEA